MKKLFLSLLLCVVGVLSSFGYEYTDDNGVTWTFDVTTYEGIYGAYISGVANCPAEVTIPAIVKDGETEYEVKWIGYPNNNYNSYSPFYINSTITSVVLPSTVIGICYCAFYGCTKLENIDLSACTSIGSSAFYGCSSLTSVGDLAACTSIGSSAFSGCSSLTSVGDLAACTSIDNFAFYDCSSLTSVGYLAACTNIGQDAFYSCNKLQKVTLGNSVCELASTSAFSSCTTILVPEEVLEDYRNADVWKDIAQKIISKDAITDYDVTVAVDEHSSGLQKAIGEDNLVNVMKLRITGDINGYDIFVMRNKMPNLHSLDMSDANIVANDYPYYCSYKTKDNIFPDYAFYQQEKLIDVKLPNSVTSIGQYAFCGCSLTDVVLGNSLTSIDDCAFDGCYDLTEINIPEGVLSLGSYAFSQCSLSTVTLPSTLKTIGDNTFYDCNFSTIEIPASVTSIGNLAFYYCSNLTEITLPSMLKSLGSYAFINCSKLRTVKVSAIDPASVSLYDNSFEAYTNKTLYVPYDEETGWDATYWAYYWHTQWGQFGTIEKWKPNYTDIGIDGDYDQDKGEIPGDEIDVTLGFEGGYILGKEGDASQAFDDLVLRNNGSKGSSIIADNNLRVNKLSQEIDVEGNRWYFFCFPFDVKVADIQAPGQSVWRKYNAAVRAATGNSGWQSLGSEEKTLKAGTGYIFQCNQYGTLILPIDNPDFTAEDKDVTLETHTSDNKQDASWNFVGNPYPSYYELEDVAHDAPVTYWNGSSYVAVRPGDDDYAIQPYQAFFVQKTEASDEVGFDKTKRETYKQSKEKANKAKAKRAKSAVNPDRLLLNITISDGENTDKTRVVFNDKHQMGYEPECDASKFMSTEAVPQIYTTHANVNYAINERPNLSGEVQLCFKAPKAGTYTIAMARMDTPMLLKDAETNQTFDFVNGAYTFEAEAGENTSRFLLVKNSDITAIHPTTVGESESAAFFNLAGQQTSASTKGVKIVKTNGATKKVLTK